MRLAYVNPGKYFSASMAYHVLSRVSFRFSTFRLGNCGAMSVAVIFVRRHSYMLSSTRPGNTNQSI